MSTAPTTTSPLPGLLRLVREAKGPDRDLDYAVHNAVCPAARDGKAGRYTINVNAVLALIADRLPGWKYVLANAFAEGHSGTVWRRSPRCREDEFTAEEYEFTAPTPALALLAAALEAIIAQAKQP